MQIFPQNSCSVDTLFQQKTIQVDISISGLLTTVEYDVGDVTATIPLIEFWTDVLIIEEFNIIKSLSSCQRRILFFSSSLVSS